MKIQTIRDNRQDSILPGTEEMHMKRPTMARLVAFVAASLVLAGTLVACGDSGTTETTTGAATDAPLAILADIVWGPLNIPDDQRGAQVCVSESRFPRNSEIVWRARAIGPDGAQLDDTQMSTMQVKLSDGQVLDMRYGPHPRENPTDFFWTTSFDIPEDYPTGTLGYEVIGVDTASRTGVFEPFNVASSLLTITDEVLATIEEAS